VLVRFALALAILAVAAPRADAKPTCRSGHTEFTHGHTRIFSLHFEDETEWRICSLRLRRPRLVGSPTGLIESMYRWQARGRRVAFEHDWIGGDEEGWAVGWVDVTTGVSHEVTVANSDGITDIPVADGADGIALGSDGSIAFVAKKPAPETGAIIGYVPYAGRFGAPRVVVSDADAVPASLTLNGDTIGWRTAAGAQMSARVNAVAAAASRTTTIIGSRAASAAAAAARPATRASIVNPSSAVKVS
jgi:hypothetical protein